MSTVVLVAGTGRCGTSAISGVLHKLGVSMGEEFTGSGPSNKYGTFEEKEFFQFNRAVRDGDDVDSWLREYIQKRSDAYEFWGLKDPVLARVFPLVASYAGSDVKVIVARRNRTPVISSYTFAYHAKLSDANDWYDRENEYLQSAIDVYPGPILYVDFDDLVEHPEREVLRIAEYVFGDVWEGIRSPGFIKKAVGHIRTDGRRFDRDGKWIAKSKEPKDSWGNLAIGVRIAKFPEYHFFNSWTQLLTGGVRNGDTVLMPVGWMPAHWAANALARDFLATDKDSLLMVDDDMVFDQHSLEALRSNEANWEYDIVFGFCTHRSWPPKPVVMREMDEQPDLPGSLLGRSYEYAYGEVEDNALIEVDAVGLAFTLIKRHVFEAMTEEYGPMYTDYFTYGKGFESDDIPFAQKARELGFRLAVDTSVKIGHIGQTTFGWREYQQWSYETRRPNVVEFDASDLIPILKEAIPHLDEHKEQAINALDWIGGKEDA